MSVVISIAVGCGSTPTEDATFVAWGSSTSSITLAWQPVDGATGYQLDRDGRDGVTLSADDTQYLDSGLAEGSYTYHLTALGVTAPREDATGKTSERPAIVTTDDPLIGDPVSGAGVAELPVARASVADGTTLTLQAIAPPTGAPDVAIVVSSDTVPTAPVEVAFVLDDEDLASLSNVAIAAKQPDGTWVGVAARVEGNRAIVTIAPEVHHAFAAPAAWQWRYVKFRCIRIDPVPVLVRANTEAAVVAKAVFSDDVCQTGTPVACIPANDDLIQLRAPIVLAYPVQNQVGTWKLDGPGTLDYAPDEHFATYIAPSSRPSRNVWSITFDMDKAPFLAVTQVRWLSDHFELTFDYHNPADIIGTGLEAAVTDKVFFGLDASGTAVSVTDGPYNMDSKVELPRSTLTDVTVTQTSRYELISANRVEIGDSSDGHLALTLYGTQMVAGVTLTYPDGSTVMIPGTMGPATLGLGVAGIHFDQITAQKTFEVTGTMWTLTVSPIATM